MEPATRSGDQQLEREHGRSLRHGRSTGTRRSRNATFSTGPRARRPSLYDCVDPVVGHYGRRPCSPTSCGRCHHRIARTARGRTPVLRKQLARYVECQTQPKCADNATRVALVLLSRFVAWRKLLMIVSPNTLVRSRPSSSVQAREGAIARPRDLQHVTGLHEPQSVYTQTVHSSFFFGARSSRRGAVMIALRALTVLLQPASCQGADERTAPFRSIPTG